jgi:hypothetical protein
VIRADAHRDAALFAELDERREPLADPLEFGGVLLVSVLDDLELLRVRVVPGLIRTFSTQRAASMAASGLK